jgi:membrane protein implicated in regulation of membrane protease activity
MEEIFMWYLWLIAAGIFFIIEIATVGFLIFWLGIGALFAMVASFFTDNLLIQTTVFVISSSVLIPLTKPIVNKYFDDGKTIATNAYSLIGKVGIVTTEINTLNSTGQVKVNGEIWSAKANEDIKQGTEVEILKIDGVKLIVKPKTPILN